MVESVSRLVIVAAEGVPGGSAAAVLGAPAGVLVFLGTIYMLLRSNLGTRRAYLVLGSAFFGFLFLMSLFWAYGAPGTPRATGPVHLPGQPANQYTPHWVPFAIDSRIAETPTYSFVRAYPEGFQEVPEELGDRVDSGVQDAQSFFSTEQGGQAIGDMWEPVEIRYARAPNNFLVVGAVFQEVDRETSEVVPDGQTETLFAFFDPGAAEFPALLLALLSLGLFILHAFLLDRDEQRERREAAAEVEEREPVAA
jgi:hypothetical protein